MNEHSVSVLLIEDNPEHVAFFSQLVGSATSFSLFRFSYASTLVEGLEQIAKGGIQLLLLDLTLPDSEGLETFIRAVEVAPNIPIIVLSGLDDVSLAIETVQLGAQDYLVKGHVDSHLLFRSMEYALERKRIQLQLKFAYDELESRVEERTGLLQQTNTRLQREVAERVRAEEETLESNRQLANALGQLRETQQQIIQRERMHALGRMANGIAHDFNNALSPILGFSELLLMKPEILQDPVKTRTYVEMIYQAAKDSATVVSRLREFYRHRDESEVFTPVVINDLVQHVICLTQPRWKDQALAAGVNITIKTDFQNVPSIAGNEFELRQALVNLIFNATDAIPGRGTILLRTEVRDRWVVITVKDDGIGMSKEVKARCLEPFFSTKDDQGTGLGLGSVYGIVRRHEGEIEIESEPNRGTAVSISLPMDRTPSEAPATQKPVKEPIDGSKPLRILVVEDEPLVREVLSVYLDEDHHHVTMASNGREALETFKKGTFDLVLTDRAMPEMNGDQLAGEIKQLKPQLPVILLTGFGDLMCGAGEQPPGVDLVVSKPFTLNTLREAILKSVNR